MEQELISGTIAAVVFYNQTNCYAVLRLESEDDSLVTVVGTIPTPVAGERLIITGKWTTHSTYGKQFEAEFLERLLPDTRKEILTYLSSRTVRGIGEKTAQKIVERFGCHSLEILEMAPERLIEISGISMKKALEIGASFRAQVGVRRLIEMLTAYHIPAEIAVRVYRVHGERSMELIHENPYLLTKPQFGASFSDTDAMALEMGFDGEDSRRIDAAVIFELRYNLNNGHTFLPQDKLIPATALMLNLSEDLVALSIDRLSELGEIVCDNIRDRVAVYLPEYHEAEEYICSRVLQMSQTKVDTLPVRDRFIKSIEQELDIIYAQLQKEAICAAAERRILLLTGGPGTGKTTTLTGILALYRRLNRKTLLAAPTGRAAKRLSELTGQEASTIHRLLEAQISPITGEMFFLHDENEPLDCDAVIIDEMSMVDVLLMHSLFRAIPQDATVILVGDPDQLPSVGAGNLFADLIRSGIVHTIALTEIFRQAQQSLIVMNAHAVNHGQLPLLTATDRDFFFMKRRSPEAVVNTIVELCAQRLPKNMGISSSEIQVISPTRKGETGTYRLNLALQAALNPKAATKREKQFGEISFREGDRVMQIRNNYDIPWTRDNGKAGTGIFNGDIGMILEILPQEDSITIRFDDRTCVYNSDMLPELELAYAITAHKSQGSEYNAVIFVPYASYPMLLTRSILYTAITRAKDLLILVGNEEIVAQMTNNNRKNKRYSGLRFRLLEALK